MIYDALQKLPRFILGSHPSPPSTPLFRLGILTGHDKKFLPERTLSRCKPQWLQPRCFCHSNKISKLLDALSSEKNIGGQKNIEFKEKRIQSPKKKSETKGTKKNPLFSCNSILRLAFWVLSCSPRKKKHVFFQKKKHQNIGSPERISQRKLPGSIHWALSATTTCRKFPNHSKVGWAEKSPGPQREMTDS